MSGKRGRAWVGETVPPVVAALLQQREMRPPAGSLSRRVRSLCLCFRVLRRLRRVCAACVVSSCVGVSCCVVRIRRESQRADDEYVTAYGGQAMEGLKKLRTTRRKGERNDGTI